MRIAVKACLIATLCAVNLAGSLRVCAQEESQLLQDDRPKAPEKRKLNRVDFLYMASEGYLAGGTWLDASTTAGGLHHPTMAYGSNNLFLMRYVVTEDGWAGCLGKRDAFTASGANVLLNLGISELSRRWYRRGGRWRIAAIGLNGAKATDNLIAGIRNDRLNASIDQRVRTLTGYRGVIIWSH
jgi:hypothetical protein